MEQAVLELGALDLDVVGELEAPLERARRDVRRPPVLQSIGRGCG